MLYKSWEDVIKFINGYFSILFEAEHKKKFRKGLKILTIQQMLQRLPIALSQVKAGNTSENLLNEIRQIIFFLYREKEVTKKSIQQYNEFNKVIKQNEYYIYKLWE